MLFSEIPQTGDARKVQGIQFSSLSFPSHSLKYIQFHCPENIFLNLHFTGFWDRLILFYSPITFLMRKSLSAGIDTCRYWHGWCLVSPLKKVSINWCFFLGRTASDSGRVFTHIAPFIFVTLASMYFNHGQSFLDLSTLPADGSHFRYHPI